MVVRGPYSSCSIELDGKQMTSDELMAVAHSEAKPGRAARVETDMADTPYRCIGGVIYTLQLAGFRKVGFVSEAPPTH